MAARCWCGKDWFEWLDCCSDRCERPELRAQQKGESDKEYREFVKLAKAKWVNT